MMPRKSANQTEETEKETVEPVASEGGKEEIEKLNQLLAAVLTYLSDDDVEEIDIEYLLDHTEGLRDWWNQYRERNRKAIEDEIKKSLGDLTLEELESIREKIKVKQE